MRNQIISASKGRDIVPASNYSYYDTHSTSGLTLVDRAPAEQKLLDDLLLVGTETVVDATVDTTDADATCTMDDTTVITAGMGISGAGIPSGASVASITNATTFELDVDATATASNISATFSIWGNGKIVPQGDHKQRFTTTAISDACRLNNKSNQLIIALDIFGTAAPSGAGNQIIYFGRNSAGFGAWSLSLLQTSGLCQFIHYSAVDGLATDTKNGATDLTNSAEHTVFIALDPLNLVGSLYVDGAIVGGTFDLTHAGDRADLCAANTIRGFSVFCQSQNDGGSTWQANPLGLATTGLRIDQLFMLDTVADQSANMDALALAWHNKPSRELPSEFDGI